jgi:hypothetical protein
MNAIDRLKAALDRYDNQQPQGTEEIDLLASVALAARAVVRENDRSVWVVLVPDEDSWTYGSSHVAGVYRNKEDAEKIWPHDPQEYEVQ